MKKVSLIVIISLFFAPKANAWAIIPERMYKKFQSGNFEPTDLIEFGLHLIQLLIEVAGASAVVLIMIGGYRYVIGSFMEEKEGGKNTLKYAIFGFVVCILSWIIVDLIITFLTSD